MRIKIAVILKADIAYYKFNIIKKLLKRKRDRNEKQINLNIDIYINNSIYIQKSLLNLK